MYNNEQLYANIYNEHFAYIALWHYVLICICQFIYSVQISEFIV